MIAAVILYLWLQVSLRSLLCQYVFLRILRMGQLFLMLQ